jgi:hypothetical protein
LGIIRETMRDIRGREEEIYSCFTPRSRTHVRCPFPDHDDRNPSFRSDSRTGRWFCTCGTGDVLDFVQRIGVARSPSVAAAYVREQLGLPAIDFSRNGSHRRHSPKPSPLQPKTDIVVSPQTDADRKRHTRSQLAKARHLWRASIPATGTPVETYLRSRGLNYPRSHTVRGLPPGHYGRFGAMIAPFGLASEEEPGILDISSFDVYGIHLTFLTDDGKPARNAKGLRKITMGVGQNFPIMLAPPNDGLGLVIAEGIEDALSAHEATNLGAWAAGTANRLPGLAQHVPDWIECCTVLVDNDEAGRRESAKLIAALEARGMEVRSYAA